MSATTHSSRSLRLHPSSAIKLFDLLTVEQLAQKCRRQHAVNRRSLSCGSRMKSEPKTDYGVVREA